MDTNVINELQNGLSAAYINGSVATNLAYKPAFVSNNPEEGKKVISSVEDELMRCDQFQISVAFITMGGVTPLLQTLKGLEEKGVKGQILTTNYLNFSEPRALEKLNGLKNITLKMYDVEAAGNGFHTKGYIFSKAMENPGFIRMTDIQDIYMPMGFPNFKIEGRGLGSVLILEFLLYYMTRPEYQIHVREEIYLDNMLDLFRTSARPNIDNKDYIGYY